MTQVYYKDAKVKQVDVPTFSGNFGILPDHVPTLAVLKPGVINVTEEDGSNKRYFGKKKKVVLVLNFIVTWYFQLSKLQRMEDVIQADLNGDIRSSLLKMMGIWSKKRWKPKVYFMCS